MSILTSSLTIRRYRVVGEVQDSFRDDFAEGLRSFAFRETKDEQKKEEQFGWVEIHNLLDTEFSDINKWLYDSYLIFALRVDKKILPSRLFKAHLEKRIQAWCEEHGTQRCPGATKVEIKELLEFEMMKKTLPRVQVYEACWNINAGWLMFHNQSDAVNDRFRKLFFQSFGLKIVPETPLDLLDDPDLADTLMLTGGLDYSSAME